MTKKQISGIMARAESAEVQELCEEISAGHKIEMMKPPQKTLVMVKVRESVKQSLFYLGEILATECMVMVDGHKGISVMAGDDFEKAQAAAVIDGYLNAGGKNEAVFKRLREMEEQQRMIRSDRNKELLKSKVNFQVMGEEA